MEDDGAVEMQSWESYFRQPHFSCSLGLQLMPNVGERITTPFLAGGHGGSPECSIPNSFPPKRCIFPSLTTDYERAISYHQNRDSANMLQVFSGGKQQQLNSYGAFLAEDAVGLVDPSKQQDFVALKQSSKGKGRALMDPKPKRIKGAMAQREESVKSSTKRRRSAKKRLEMVINGIELDLSGIPAPLCTCTGQPQQCYRWGAGGWQSACCTTTISIYPLPMSTKRRGARISGRKMSQGAFKKLLEKLAGEGQDFSNPINLKPFWAKHGTNKFVTIR